MASTSGDISYFFSNLNSFSTHFFLKISGYYFQTKSGMYNDTSFVPYFRENTISFFHNWSVMLALGLLL